MRISRLLIGVFAVIMFHSTIASHHVSTNSIKAAHLTAPPQDSNVLIADGSDPLPKPWHKLVA